MSPRAPVAPLPTNVGEARAVESAQHDFQVPHGAPAFRSTLRLAWALSRLLKCTRNSPNINPLWDSGARNGQFYFNQLLHPSLLDNEQLRAVGLFFLGVYVLRWVRPCARQASHTLVPSQV